MSFQHYDLRFKDVQSTTVYLKYVLMSIIKGAQVYLNKLFNKFKAELEGDFQKVSDIKFYLNNLRNEAEKLSNTLSIQKQEVKKQYLLEM